MPFTRFPASIELACLFPPAQGFKGACTTIADLSGLRGLLYPSKWLAVHTCVERNMERAEPYGKGGNAERRLHRQRMSEVAADLAHEPQWTPTPADLNRMAAIEEERYTEGRKHRPFPANIHD